MFNYNCVTCFQEGDLALYEEIYKATDSINKYYPGHFVWFHDKFLPELKLGKRIIIYASDEDGRIAGVALLKRTEEEDKICCLFVSEQYRRHGIASQLFERSLAALNNKKPKVTVSEVNFLQLKKLLEKFNFELTDTKTGEYIDGEKEFYFN